MSAHQHHPVRAKTLRQIAALLRIDHQHVGITELVADVPYRDTRAHVAGGVDHRLQHTVGDGEGQHFIGVAVHHGMDVRACFIDAAMNEALQIGWTGVAGRGIAGVVELHDVLARHQLRAA